MRPGVPLDLKKDGFPTFEILQNFGPREYVASHGCQLISKRRLMHVCGAFIEFTTVIFKPGRFHGPKRFFPMEKTEEQKSPVCDSLCGLVVEPSSLELLFNFADLGSTDDRLNHTQNARERISTP